MVSHLVDSLLDIVSIARCDVSMERLILGRQRSSVLETDFPFLHRTLATDDDRRAGLPEH